MKLLFALSFLLCVGTAVKAQESALPYDERGKLIYYEIVELKGVSKDSLDLRSAYFFTKNAKRIKLKSGKNDTLQRAEGKLIINKTALVLTRPSGEINYSFFVETKDGKYRFWLTDFVFIPYQRDRYGNFVASTTVGVPLENKPGKLNAAEWKGYTNNTTREVRLLGAQFKEVMAHKQIAQPVSKPKEVISTKKW